MLVVDNQSSWKYGFDDDTLTVENRHGSSTHWAPKSPHSSSLKARFLVGFSQCGRWKELNCPFLDQLYSRRLKVMCKNVYEYFNKVAEAVNSHRGGYVVSLTSHANHHPYSFTFKTG